MTSKRKPRTTTPVSKMKMKKGLADRRTRDKLDDFDFVMPQHLLRGSNPTPRAVPSKPDGGGRGK